MTSFNFDKSGKIKPATAEEWKKADEQDAILSLSRGTAADGRPYYAFIAVTPSKYAEYYRLSMEHKPFLMSDYGTVIISEYLAEPPEDVLDWMAEDYDYDPDFENKVAEQFQQEGAEFLSKGEENRINDIVLMLKQKKPNGNAQLSFANPPLPAAAKANGSAQPAAANTNGSASANGVKTNGGAPANGAKNGAAARKVTVKSGAPAAKTVEKPKTSAPELGSKSLWDRMRGK
jgi:hypothetical protein